jgi:hypothetical protein
MHAALQNKDILQLIFSFLDFKEAATAHIVCKLFHSIHKYAFYNGPRLKSFPGEYSDTDKLYFALPPLISRISRIQMTINWVDQGWGNRKGNVMIRLVNHRDLNETTTFNPFGVAAHEWTEQKVVLRDEQVVKNAKAGDIVEFWRHIGGGGGHTLSVEKFQIVLEFY